MILKRQIVLKAIVTEKLKESLIAEVQEAMGEVTDAQSELDRQSRRVMLELQRTDLNRAMAFRQQLDLEKRKQEDVKKDLQDRLAEYQGLEMDTEFVRGLLEGTVDIQEGDNLVEKLGRAEIIVKDDIVQEIRHA
jgi:capsule polysaccharide export protein KpsE/RkpR